MYRKHLDPALTQLENALNARSARLLDRGAALPPEHPEGKVLLMIAAEFHELAEELHVL